MHSQKSAPYCPYPIQTLYMLPCQNLRYPIQTVYTAVSDCIYCRVNILTCQYRLWKCPRALTFQNVRLSHDPHAQAQEQLRLYDAHLIRRNRVLTRHGPADVATAEETANAVYFASEFSLCLNCALAPGANVRDGGGHGGSAEGLRIGKHCFGTVWEALEEILKS